jgi:hypothetical protein
MTLDPAEVELAELERRVDRALKQLPAPSAPPAFASAVMRRVLLEHAGDGPGRASLGSFEWPIALKIALTAAGFALVVGALMAWPLALEYVRTGWQSPAVVLLRAAVAAVRPLVPAVLMYVTAMCVACAAAASMLKHVALGGATIHEPPSFS